MAMTSAQRQARYRERVKARAAGGGETAQATIERVRQVLLAEWFSDARREAAYRDAEDVAREIAFLERVAVRPLWHRQGFAEWLEMLIGYEIERDVTEARKVEKREASARRRRRTAPADRPARATP